MATVYVCNVENETPEPLGLPSMVTQNGRQAPRRCEGDEPAPLGKPSLNAKQGDEATQGQRAANEGQGAYDDMPEPLGKPRMQL